MFKHFHHSLNVIVLFFAAVLIVSAVGCGTIRSPADSISSVKWEELQGETIKILFMGDTSFGESYAGTPELLEKNGYDYPLEKVAPLLTSSTFVVTNLETPITDIMEAPFKDKAWNHWTNVEKAPVYLKKYNMFTFSLANNHTLDYGMPGLIQTFDVMTKNGMTWFGAGRNEEEAAKPFVKTFALGRKSFKMGVIGTFEYSRNYDEKYGVYAKGEKGGNFQLTREGVAAQIKKLKAEDPNTFVIVYPHWGDNYSWKSDKQTKAGHAFLEDGADLVIGHGAHSMQEIERVGDKWILYGIGNNMFLSPGRYERLKTKPYSYAAQLVVAEGKDSMQMRMRLYPVNSNNRETNYQVRPLNDAEFKEFTALLLEKSPLTDKQKKGVRTQKDGFGQYVEFGLN